MGCQGSIHDRDPQDFFEPKTRSPATKTLLQKPATSAKFTQEEFRTMRHSDPGIRRKALLALPERVHRGHTGAVAVIVESLTDSDPEVRATAVEVLADVANPGDQQAIRGMISLLADGNRVVTGSVVRNLANIARPDEKSAIDGICEHIVNGRDQVRRVAVEALREVADNGKSSYTMLSLENLSKHPSREVREVADRAMSQSGSLLPKNTRKSRHIHRRHA